MRCPRTLSTRSPCSDCIDRATSESLAPQSDGGIRPPVQNRFMQKTSLSRAEAGEELWRRVRNEFVEMPGLRLTEPQARRLWGLDPARCATLLDTLVKNRFLVRTRDGAFLRADNAGRD